MKKAIIATLVSLFTLNAFGQVPVNDKQKENQIRSMERGHWDFSPSWWYYFLEKKYSGASWHWKWRGFKSHAVVEFHESDSNVKGIGARREKQLAAQLLKKSIVEKERQLIKELNDEEIVRAADRNSNLVSAKYQDLFHQMQNSIADGLTYCMLKSKGKLANSVKELTNRNEVISANIAYLNQTGVGNELENAKREKGLAKAKTDMEDLLRKVISLSRVAKAFCE